MVLTNISNLLPNDFGPNPLPDWVRADERWAEQLKIVEGVYEAFKDVDVVFLQAPTGTGKTLIAELVARLLGGRYLYVCSTKHLQDQFAHDFPYISVIKGRSNYLTESGMLDEHGRVKSHGQSSITCADCTWTVESGCNWCVSKPTCPYNLAVTRARSNVGACLNYAYLLADAQHVGRFTGRRLVVADECDEIEREVLNQYQIVISGRQQAYMGLYPPKKRTVESSWVDWTKNTALPTVSSYIDTLPTPQESQRPRDIKTYNQAMKLYGKLIVLARELPKGGWVYDGYTRRGWSKPANELDSIIFQPVRVDRWGKEALWSHGEKFFLMSATILSADLMADELGLYKDWQLIDVGSSFPVKNRPIHIVPVTNMSYKNRVATGDENRVEMARAIEGVVKLHPGERVLVHCVSYDLAKFLSSELHLPSRKVVSYISSGEKQEALRTYLNYPGAVLLAASLARGVDLPDDKCRVQIVAKIPFPNIKEKRVERRLWLDGGRDWYRLQTIRTLIQMTGRGVRSKDDWCVTYILDKEFTDNLWKSNYLFPQWWKEAVDWKVNKARLGV